MIKTHLVSQFFAFMIFVQALIELIGVPIAVYYAENVGLESVWYATIPTSFFLIGFGSRFFYLLFANLLEPFWLALTWWAAAIGIGFALFLNDFRYEHFYLELPFLFPLTTAGSIFLLFSTIRFSITALAAWPCNELSSNS